MELDGAPVPAAKRCLAILVCVSTLWATEAIPLYITSLLIPILTVATQALLPASISCAAKDVKCQQQRFTPLSAPVSAKEICGQFFDPTVLLFMAGFSIGAVLEKFRISNMIASLLLKPFGNKPENVLLGIMSLGCFLSMWISNVPSSVLCVSLAQPIINQLPQRDPYAKALLIGIAISNNIGGMTTPIASPQNVIAFNWCGQAGTDMSFGGWLCITGPYCTTLLLVAWWIIRVRYPPMLRVLQMSDLTREQPRMNRDQMLALLVTTCTIVAWAFWKPLGLEPYFGSMGLSGLVPVAVFFTAGLLDRNDFHHSLNWSVLILIGGGLALGHVMERSFLLQILSSNIQTTLSGASLWTFTLAFTLFMALIANFVSSTVAAIIILPVVASVGKSVGKANLMIIASVLMDSAAMALPVSSFPNANSFAVQRQVTVTDHDAESGDAKNKKESVPILNVQDYMITGGMVTVAAQIETATLGYFLLQLFS
jgi:phosphate transporter